MTRRIKGYSHYTVDSLGNIVNQITGQKLKPLLNTNGYYRVALVSQGIQKFFYIHRLVAQTFLSNPDNKPQVNHKDGNRANYRLDNLEWVTQSENDLHSFRILNRKPTCLGMVGDKHWNAKAVTAVNLTTEQKLIFGSLAEAQRAGFYARYIRQNLRGLIKSYKGYRFEHG